LRERSVNWEDPSLSSNVPWSTIIVESWLMSFESGRGRERGEERERDIREWGKEREKERERGLTLGLVGDLERVL